MKYDYSIRTTLTLDKDVAAQLRQLQKERSIPYKTLINEALRQGLQSLTTKQRPQQKFGTASVSLGQCFIGNLDNVSDVLSMAEGDIK